MIFQKTDKDNDHKISRAEFIQHMKLTGCIAAGQWDVLFDELDADNNGAAPLEPSLLFIHVQSQCNAFFCNIAQV